MMISKQKIIYKFFKGLGIIYFVTHSVILVSINSKRIHQSKQKPKSHPQCLGPLGKFQHNIQISIKTARVSRLSVSCGHGFFDILNVFKENVDFQEEPPTIIL